MKRDLKSSKSAQSKPRQEQAIPDESDSMEALVDSLRSKDRQELMDTLSQTVQSQLRQGTFDEKGIRESIERLGTMVTPEQKQRMLALLQTVRRSD
jgi:hypothetical protein